MDTIEAVKRALIALAGGALAFVAGLGVITVLVLVDVSPELIGRAKNAFFPWIPLLGAVIAWTKFEARPSTTETQLENRPSGDLIAEYGWHLEHKAPTPGCYADESELPYPKEQIKAALKAKILREADPDRRSVLAAAYVQLADWQPGVGPDHVGIDRVMDGTRRGNGLAIWDTVHPRAEAEMMRLLAETQELEQAVAGTRSVG